MIEKKSFCSTWKLLAITFLIISTTISIVYQSINVEYLAVRLFHNFLTLKYRIISDIDRPTLSSNYRAFEEILKWKPFAEVDHQVDPVEIIQELRSSFTMVNLVPKPSKCRIEQNFVSFDQHQVEIFSINYQQKISFEPPERILIYLHGGAYALGDIQSYAGLECHLSRLFNLTVLHLEYRLSPEHPLASAVEDSIVLYRSLLEQNYSSSQILFMGDSAGGGLALLTIQSIIAQGFDVPRGVVVLSPWTDLSASGESYQRNSQTDVLLCMKKFHWLVNRVLSTNILEFSPSNPLYSPLFGSFEKFPSMFVNFGTAEVLEDDSRRIIEKAQKENIDVTFEEGKDLMHVYPIFFPYYPEAQRTLKNIQNWIQRLFSS